MHSYALSHVTDDELLADLAALVATDRRTTAALLAHLAEVDARKLFLPAACSSMLVYCVRVLRLAEEVAYKRIRAARAARRFPQIFDAIADGRLHVTGVVVLAPFLTDDNVDEVLAAAAHRSKAELEMLVARLAPKQDVPAFIVPLDPQKSAPGVLQLDPGPVATPGVFQLDPDPVAAPGAIQLDPGPVQGARTASHLQALAPDRFALQCTVSQATRDKLEWLLAMTSHSNPSGDLGELIGRACDALIKVVERERFAVTDRPRANGARPESDDPTYIPADVQRAVYKRDGGRCTYTSQCGERCGERRYLQIHHIVPGALGGKPTADNLRLLCSPHNQHEAERKLGADFMNAKRAQAKSNAAAARERRDIQHEVAAEGTAAPAIELVDEADEKSDVPPIEVVDEAYAKPNVRQLERELVDALTSLGYKSAEAQRAVGNTADTAATTFEARLRAALAALSRSRPIRCSDGPFDLSAGFPLWCALRDWRAATRMREA